MNPNLLAASAPSAASMSAVRRLAGPSAFSRHPGVLLTVDTRDEATRRAAEHWPEEAQVLLDGLAWTEGSGTVRFGRREALLFLPAPVDGLETAQQVAQRAWAQAVAAVAALDGDVHHLSDPLPALRAQYAEESRPLAALRGMVDAAMQHGVSWQLADGILTLGSGAGGESWPTRAVPAVDQVAWSRRLDVPTMVTIGEPLARDVGALVTVLVRASGVGAVFGSAVSDARDLIRDREVGALVLRLTADTLLNQVLPVTRTDVAVITAMPDTTEAAAILAAQVGPFGRLILNADVPDLVAFAATTRAPVVWFSTREQSVQVSEGVVAWGDGAALVGGHLMVAYDGIWHDAGRADRLPPGVDVATALASALAAMCLGVPLGKIVATMPA